MADGGIGNQSPSTIFQARLDTSDGVSNTLTIGQYKGNKVVVSGLTVVVPALGLTRGIADNLIDATGADGGAPPAASTLYYVYISNKKATFSPESIRLSSQAPVLASGVKYLGTVGNALNWRFVGWVRPNATPQFESSMLNRSIVNYYNRFELQAFIAPGYTNTDGFVSQSFPAAWGRINAGVGDRVIFIATGEDGIQVDMNVMAQVGGVAAQTETGISVDGGDPNEIGFSNSTSATFSIPVGHSEKPAEGVHTIDMWGFSANAGASGWYSDVPRNGLSKTPHPSYLSFLVAA